MNVPKNISLLTKIKILLYRYTGVYCLYKEENEYIDSPEYWFKFSNFKESEDMSNRNIHGLIIGIWQSHLGVTRPCLIQYLGSNGFMRFLGYFHTNLTAIWWDITDYVKRSRLYKKYSKKTS